MAVVSAFAFFLVAFVAASAAVVVAWLVIQRRTTSEAASGASIDSLSELEDAPLLLKNESLSTVSVWASLLSRFDFVQPMKARIEEAGLNWTVGRLTAAMLLSGSAVTAVLWSYDWMSGLAGMLAGGMAGFAPYFYVLRRREQRLTAFEEQFPDALDFLARSLRAGHPFAASLEMLANDSLPPLSHEMRKTFDERQLGMSWDRALDNLAVRVPLVDVGFFAAAVRLQSRTGGKLGEVLSRLAETMRERSALRGEIRSIAAHGRLTGVVLTVIPLVVVGVMALVNPAYLGILFESPHGKDLILAAAGSLVLAHFIIRRIVDIKI